MAKTLAQLEAEKKANSAAWHTASQADKDRLHAANQEIQKQIDSMSGSTSSFNDKSGTWTTTPASKPSGGSSGGSSGGGGYTPSSGGNGYTGGSSTVKNNPYVTGKDDAGQTDWSAAWDKALGSGADYDTMLGIYNGRQDKIGGGGVYGQYGGDAKSQEMESWLAANKPKVQGAQTGVNDYSDYIEAMNKAQREAALAALRAAYEKNVAGLDRTQAGIAPQYQSARNQAAGQSEQRKRAFAEYAAAQGLNSGAGGQAMLAMGNALQNNLSGIGQAEASTMADLELQRSQMETDYNNAIAQAEAQGNYELAQQLYQEKVRQDEALRQQMQWQAQMDLQQQQMQFQQGQADISNQQWNQQFQSGENQWNQSFAYKMAQELAQYGDFSGYKALGYSDEQIQGMKDAYEYQKQLAAAQKQNKYTGGGKTEPEFYDIEELYQKAMQSGDPAGYIYANGSRYGLTTTDARDYAIAKVQDMMNQPSQEPETQTGQSSGYQNLVSKLASMEDRGGGAIQQIAYTIEQARVSGQITDAEAEQLFAQYGL